MFEATTIRVVHYNEPLTDDHTDSQFREVAISNCPMGCKIYQHQVTGEQVLAHNANYNCHR